MAVELDYTKLPAEQRVGMWIAPSGGSTLGITDVDTPLTAEINNTGGTSGAVQAVHTVDWNDLGFGIASSERNSQPSLADSASYETLGASNYSGEISMFLPAQWDDNSNNHKLIWDLTREQWSLVDIIKRIDGNIESTAPAADGQFVQVYRAQTDGETNPMTPGESLRRTVSFLSRGDFGYYRPVGSQAITAITPSTLPVGAGRIRLSIQGRDVTAAPWFRWTSSNPAVINVYQGGFYQRLTSGAASITVTDRETGLSATITVAAIT